MIPHIKSAGPSPTNYVKQFIRLDAKLDPDLSISAFRKTVKNTKIPDKKIIISGARMKQPIFHLI
jgi:hypothetical protein